MFYLLFVNASTTFFLESLTYCQANCACFNRQVHIQVKNRIHNNKWSLQAVNIQLSWDGHRIGEYSVRQGGDALSKMSLSLWHVELQVFGSEWSNCRKAIHLFPYNATPLHRPSSLFWHDHGTTTVSPPQHLPIPRSETGRDSSFSPWPDRHSPWWTPHMSNSGVRDRESPNEFIRTEEAVSLANEKEVVASWSKELSWTALAKILCERNY